MSAERYDALIVGAGMSGLAAGIRLAQYDKRVAILEKHYLWGGLNSFYKLAGRRFDVGLHALTNWRPKGTRGTPLARVLRQLRLSHDQLRLGQQGHSEIVFPGLRLRFSNDFDELRAAVHAAFPAERDGFERLVRRVEAEDLGADATDPRSAREVLEEELRDPLLTDALLLPVCYYGSAAEHGPDWPLFAILFRSIFLEGLCRPEGGIKPLLDLLRRRYLDLGGELRTKAGVERILLERGRARGVVLEDGTELAADLLLSSAGYVETMGLAGEGERVAPEEVGQLSFVESISVLDREPAELGISCATAFFNRTDRLRYRRPDSLVDLDSGVISSPNNYAAEEPLPEGILRLTILADAERWSALPEEQYVERKRDLAAEAIAGLRAFYPDWNPHTVFRDVFTPRTIRRFTGHVNGAVYGSPRKRRDGDVGIPGLYLCGTDQGMLGVVGALVGGISIANRYGLSAPAAAVPAR